MSLFEGKEVNEESLKALKYHELKDAFAELGIPGVWKQGRKGADMIAEAIGKLEDIKNGLDQSGEVNPDANEGTGEPDINPAEQSKGEDQESNEEQESEAQNPADKGITEPATKESPVKVELSEEEKQVKIDHCLERLENIKKNLWGGISSHRAVLLQHQARYVAQLEELSVKYEHE